MLALRLVTACPGEPAAPPSLPTDPVPDLLWDALGPWSRLMSAVLNGAPDAPGPGNEQAGSSTPADWDAPPFPDQPLFSFPAVRRRVETIELLSENGQHRTVSLDLDTHEMRRAWTAAASEVDCAVSAASLTSRDYGTHLPFPCYLADKGIFIDFSATDRNQRLELEQKTTSQLAGYAWLLGTCGVSRALATPDSKPAVNVARTALRRHFWRICHTRESGRRPPEGTALTAIPPLHDIPPLHEEDRHAFVDDLEPLDADDRKIAQETFQDSWDDLAGNTTFMARLNLLQLNYFAMLVLPTEHDPQTPGIVVKFDTIYGDPAEKILKAQWEQRSRQLRLPSRMFLPPRPFVHPQEYFGDLEGHCEHIHLRTPPGIELTTDWWRRLTTDWWRRRRGDAARPDTSRVEGFLVFQHDADNVPDNAEYAQSITAETDYKIFPQLLTVRRHRSHRVPLVIQIGYVADLKGIFMPAIIALAMLIGWSSYLLIGWCLNLATPLPTSYITVALGVAVGVVTYTVNQESERVRLLLLRPLLRRVNAALAIGALSIVLVGLWPDTPSLPVFLKWFHRFGLRPDTLSLPVSLKVFHGLGLLVMGYAAFYLLAARELLYRARHSLSGDRWAPWQYCQKLRPVKFVLRKQPLRGLRSWIDGWRPKHPLDQVNDHPTARMEGELLGSTHQLRLTAVRQDATTQAWLTVPNTQSDTRY